MKLFSGLSNKSLVDELIALSAFELGEVEVGRFANRELRIRVGEVDDKVCLLQSFSVPVHQHIFEYLLMADALHRQGAGQIVSIIPWFGYSKQDKVFVQGEPLSVKVVAKVLQTTKASKIITFDLHNPSITGYLDIPVVNLSAASLFIDHARGAYDLSKTIAISPDAGSVKSTTKIAHGLGIPVAYINKSRDLETGKVEIHGIDRDISGMQTLIFDDMISTGSTIIQTAQFLNQHGADHVGVYATHHLYVDGVMEMIDKSHIDRLVVTNTIEKPESIESNKLEVLSVADLIASHIKP